jgi:PAS domain S-box-containing protein
MKTNTQETFTRLIVYLLVANSLITAFAYGFLALIGVPHPNRLVGSLIMVPIFGSLLLLLRRGQHRLVKFTAITLNFVLVLLQVWLDGGFQSPDFFTLLVGASLAILAFGLPGAVITTLLSLAAGFAFSRWQASPMTYTPAETMMTQFTTFVTIAFYIYFTLRFYRHELARNSRLNESLAKSEARLKELIMKLPLSALVIEHNETVSMVNENLTQVLGFTASDLRTTQDWYANAYADAQTGLERMTYWKTHPLELTSPPFSGERELYSKTKERFFFEVYVRMFGDGGIILLNDITARKEVEKALRDSEEKFRAIIEQSSEAILLMDDQGKIIQLNKATEILCGLKPDEILGQYSWDIQARMTPPELRSNERTENYRKMLLDSIRSGDPPAQRAPTEEILLCPDGERRMILNSIFILNLQAGTRVCSSMVDITERKRAEEMLSNQQAKLLETEQARRKTLETIERISLDLRRAKNKTVYYFILLKSCIQFLGAHSGMVFEARNGAYELIESQEINWFELENSSQKQLHSALMEFSGSPKTISVNPVPLAEQPFVLVKLLSENSLIGFLVLVWHKAMVSEDEQMILETIAEITGIALDRMRVLETLEDRVKNRTRELRVLYDMMQLYISNDNIEYVIKESLKILLKSILADGYVFFMVEPDGQQLTLVSYQGPDLKIANEGQLFNPDDLGWAPILSSDKPVIRMEPLFPFLGADGDPISPANHFLGVPVRGDNGLLAVMGFYYAQNVNLALEEFNLINLFADQIGMVIERNILRQKVRNAAVLEERQRLSRELHDSLTQSLYSLKLFSDAARRLAGQEKWDEVNRQLSTIFDISMQALKEMRLLIYELVPESIEQLGLIAALEQRLNFVERRAGIQVEFTHQGQVDLSKEAQMSLYRFALEALNNATKHAEATQIKVRFSCDGHGLSLQVSDNGKGFDLTSVNPGMGLNSMKDRIQQLGGQMNIDTQPGSGTVVFCSLGS